MFVRLEVALLGRLFKVVLLKPLVPGQVLFYVFNYAFGVCRGDSVVRKGWSSFSVLGSPLWYCGVLCVCVCVCVWWRCCSLPHINASNTVCECVVVVVVVSK